MVLDDGDETLLVLCATVARLTALDRIDAVLGVGEGAITDGVPWARIGRHGCLIAYRACACKC